MKIKHIMDILKRVFWKGVYPHQMTWFLDLPVRRFIYSPRKLADRLPLEKSSTVLELGPGSGYYSVEVARRIPEGHLELFDIQQEMLDKCRSKFQAAGFSHVDYTHGNGSDFPFEDNMFDVVYMVSVFGEIEDQMSCLTGIKRILKPGGSLSITEHYPDPDFTSLSEVKEAAISAGFKFTRSLGWRWAFTVNFVV